MPGHIRSRTTAALFASLLLTFIAVPVYAQIKLDLPAQPLGQSLTAIGTLGHVNVMFDPVAVDGLKAPALKAELSAQEALDRLLTGTKLHAVRVDANTIRVITGPTVRQAQPPRTSITGDALIPPSSPAYGDAQSSTTAYSSDAENPGVGTTRRTKSTEGKPEDVEQVVVTGTHIHGIAPLSPVLEIGQEYIDRSGYTDIGDVIRSVPQFYAGGSSPQFVNPTVPGNNESLSGGTAPNLHGLGPTSTLTLIDGHRLATENLYGASDISLIPIDAIDHVEVLTDGASAIYGADAVAGVVNVITRRDYSGIRLSGSFGDSTQGGGLDRRGSLLTGTRWSSGGGLLAYEYDDQETVDSGQRDFTSTALSPTSLLPSSRHSSVYGSVHQDFAGDLSAFATGTYTHRDVDYSTTYPPTYVTPTSVNQYLISGGLTATLTSDWRLTTVASSAYQDTGADNYAPSDPPDTLFHEDFRGRSTNVELNADGPLFALPSGMARGALGGGYTRETYLNSVEAEGFAQTSIDAQRHYSYLFAELLIPVVDQSDRVGLKKLDFTASGRYQNYSDFGSDSVPKLTLAYVPLDHWLFTGSWGRAFAAPPLPQAYQLQNALEISRSDPLSPTGHSIVLQRTGGNPTLRPESAETWTLGVTFTPEWANRLKLATTYFNIRYNNRIQHIPDAFAALTDPADASAVTRSPSPDLLQAILAESTGGFMNRTGMPYNAADIAAVIDGRFLNIARQRIDGVDTSADYGFGVGSLSVELFANGAYLELRQQLTPNSPEAYLTGTSFNPPKWRGRAGGALIFGPWSWTSTLNYVGSATNTYQPGSPGVASWTTLDEQLALSLPQSGLRIGLTVLNAFDRTPPYVLFDTILPGFHYDPTNSSPLGRYVTLQVSKAFGGAHTERE